MCRWWSSTPTPERWRWTGGTSFTGACLGTRARWKTSARSRSRRWVPLYPPHTGGGVRHDVSPYSSNPALSTDHATPTAVHGTGFPPPWMLRSRQTHMSVKRCVPPVPPAPNRPASRSIFFPLSSAMICQRTTIYVALPLAVTGKGGVDGPPSSFALLCSRENRTTASILYMASNGVYSFCWPSPSTQ